MNVTIRRGEIWRVLVPFGGDAVGAKERPAAVVGWSKFGPNEDQQVLVVPISTFGGDATKARNGDIRPANYAASRLSSGSFIRTRRLMALTPKAFQFSRGPIGMLDSRDIQAVLTELQRLITGTTSISI